ncbi:IPT/TIG domain-containing protein [Candidatus Saccharibacteria bacterium]|nr:IPT/TIG domain-containing protein [Candidatus Saccharibacteria bacterium]
MSLAFIAILFTSPLTIYFSIEAKAFSPSAADFNGNGSVESEDLIILNNNWGQRYTYGSGSPNGPGDANRDGIVNILDMSAVAGQWRSQGTPNPPSGDFAITNLSTNHAKIGATITINGRGFGTSRGSSRVWFGELPQYRFPDSIVARPCTKEAASYISWSDTQIVVTVPSMSPGLAEANGTHHPVYVEVGGVQTNTSDFFIDPVITLDASSSISDWQSVFPNSTVKKETVTYTNSTGSRHASYTTHVTLSSDNAPHPAWGNVVKTGSHDVLIKDTSFISLSNGLNPSDSGVITMGSYEYGDNPGNIYNITFYNSIIHNNMQNNSGWNGTNAIKIYHGDENAGRVGDWTFSDCSFGTPNSPGGAFSRFGIEFVENNRGFSSYRDVNYLHNIRISGSDFEPTILDPISLAFGGRGPDRGILIDNDVFKGNGSAAIEVHLYGMVVRDVDVWSGGFVSLEGNSTEFGGVSYIGPQSHLYFLRVNLRPEIQYEGILPHGSVMFNADNYGGVVFDDCNFNFGNSDNHYSIASYASSFSTNDGWDMSTSYMFGLSSWGPNPKTTSVQYWTDWTNTDPMTLLGNKGMKWPRLGPKP